MLKQGPSWFFCLWGSNPRDGKNEKTNGGIILGQAAYKWVASVEFWDCYAKWYKLWIEHTDYHGKIIEVLMAMTGPGWRVLDIGAGNGILSFPLHSQGCHVTALEPSMGMRNLLHQEAFKKRVDRLNVDDRRWEAVPRDEFLDADLILACNSLHLTEIGFEMALAKIFRTRPRNVLLITELGPPEIRVRWPCRDYTVVLTKSFDVDNSYAYHHLNEMVEHWTFIKGSPPQPDEISDLKNKIILKNGHLWIKHTSRVVMYWWKWEEMRKEL